MDIESLRNLVGTSRDSAMLRLMLARALADDDIFQEAMSHLEAAIDMDPGYTAAWKELGKVRNRAGDSKGAAEAWTAGIEAARENGDKQAEREMKVFLKRIL